MSTFFLQMLDPDFVQTDKLADISLPQIKKHHLKLEMFHF